MDVSIAIVSWNTSDLLNQCLTSIIDTTTNLDYEIIVVDNASTDGSVNMIAKTYPQVKLIKNKSNLGFAHANNQAYKISSGKYFLMLNPDTICLKDAITNMADFLDMHNSVGAVGPLVLYEDKSIQYSWAKFPTLITEIRGKPDTRIGKYNKILATVNDVKNNGEFQVDWVCGCSMMIRRVAVESVGMLDEAYFMYTEETDLCLRLNNSGYSVWVCPKSEIIHLCAKSSIQVKKTAVKYLIDSKTIYFDKHIGRLPAYLLNRVLCMKLFIRGFVPRQ